MSDPFKLTVPADERYRSLAPDVAAKYAEVSGGSASDGQALSAAVRGAIDKLVHGSHHGAGVDLAFHVAAGHVEIHVQCEDRATVVKHHLHGRH